MLSHIIEGFQSGTAQTPDVTEVEKAIAEGDQLVINNALEQIELKQLFIFSHLPQAEVSGKKIPIVFLPPVIISFFFAGAHAFECDKVCC